MRRLLIVSNPKNWKLRIPGVELVGAQDYLGNPEQFAGAGIRVYNLCRSYRYQTQGYYISLLAEARGHRPLPNVTTIQDLKNRSLIRFYSDELEDLIQKSLAHLQAKEFQLSIYFGRNVAKRYDRLAHALFNVFPAPLLRAEFVHGKEGWEMRRIGVISENEIPDTHHDFLNEAADRYFRRQPRPKKQQGARYDLAILYDPEEDPPTSDLRALKAFIKAGAKLGLAAELITKDDYGSLAEFDALFIRETTSVKNHTFRFSRRATAEGLVVIDDPESILKCMNKVYLAELMQRHKIRTPKTMVVHWDNAQRVLEEMGLPCVLKQPDSAFSQGVVKAKTPEELKHEIERLLDSSELIIAQEFLPTDFDWRIGVLDQKPLYACKYFMARSHWQIYNHEKKGAAFSGEATTLAIEDVPAKVVDTAVKAANLIGDGLYGVDLKEVGGKVYVIEVNDNPSIEHNIEDEVIGEELYLRIMRSFLERIEKKRGRTQS